MLETTSIDQDLYRLVDESIYLAAKTRITALQIKAENSNLSKSAEKSLQVLSLLISEYEKRKTIAIDTNLYKFIDSEEQFTIVQAKVDKLVDKSLNSWLSEEEEDYLYIMCLLLCDYEQKRINYKR